MKVQREGVVSARYGNVLHAALPGGIRLLLAAFFVIWQLPNGLAADEESMVRDIDGNRYTTVVIASGDSGLSPQVWMKENLAVTRYRNGDRIVHARSAREWQQCNREKKGAWCYYKNDTRRGGVYGKLYNWYAVNDPRGLAPEGWHVPSDLEWAMLERHMGMPVMEAYERGYRGKDTNVGGKLKLDKSRYWAYPNAGATNESGFAAQPGGYRQHFGTFLNEWYQAYFWTSTGIGDDSALSRSLFSSNSIVSRYNNSKSCGFSVRCVKD